MHVTATPADANGGRGVLDGAFALLDLLEELGEAGLTRLSDASNLPKATAHRLLGQLAALGAVEKTGNRYRVGPRIFSLGMSWRPDPALLQAARSPMLRLAKASGASVALGVLAHGETILAAGVRGETARRVPIEPRVAWPQSSAAARALLAWADPGTHQSAPPMSASLAEHIRGEGRVFNREEILPGICCVAVPLMRPDPGAPVAVLCAVVDASHPLPGLAANVTRTSAAITASLR
jgi:DNA-binding IclR family transcriptional regulator